VATVFEVAQNLADPPADRPCVPHDQGALLILQWRRRPQHLDKRATRAPMPALIKSWHNFHTGPENGR
jgi:hypothetical protein